MPMPPPDDARDPSIRSVSGTGSPVSVGRRGGPGWVPPDARDGCCAGTVPSETAAPAPAVIVRPDASPHRTGTGAAGKDPSDDTAVAVRRWLPTAAAAAARCEGGGCTMAAAAESTNVGGDAVVVVVVRPWTVVAVRGTEPAARGK